MYSTGAAGIGGLISFIVILGVAALALVILYWIIKRAIRTAMADHYKTVLIYEKTGEWALGPHPKGPPPVLPDGSPNPGYTPPGPSRIIE